MRASQTCRTTLDKIHMQMVSKARAASTRSQGWHDRIAALQVAQLPAPFPAVLPALTSTLDSP